MFKKGTGAGKYGLTPLKTRDKGLGKTCKERACLVDGLLAYYTSLYKIDFN
jgi:hypothetical protein